MGRLHPSFLEKHGLLGRSVFIETGTQHGIRARKIAPFYDQLHTIELDPQLYRHAAEYLVGCKNVCCHLGDSAQVLPQIINPERETVFFLDAHYVATAPSPKQVDRQCPLLGELAAIFSTPWKVPPIILIDDAQLFWDWCWRRGRNVGYDRAQWPRYEEIEDLAKTHDYQVTSDRYVLIVARQLASKDAS